METEGWGHPLLGRHSPNHQAALPPPHRASRVHKQPMENPSQGLFRRQTSAPGEEFSSRETLEGVLFH